MKNIHVLPTENSSRLSYNKDGVLELHRLQWRKNTQNIYITSDEEIAKEDFVIEYIFDNLVFKVCSITSKNVQKSKFNSFPKKHCKKIILTDNQDLIKDGVQAIDDEFLEWFVKNPSCEYIKTEKWLDDECGVLYSRTIPKEEPKQEILEDISLKYHQTAYENLIKELTKQETLKEAAKEYAENEIKDRGTDDDKLICSIDFIAGAKWQQEQDKNKYSEEEVLEILNKRVFDLIHKKDIKTNKEWFEKLKNK